MALVVQDTISLKEVIINIENDELEPMINKMMLRFPHLAQDTFKELDNKTMVNCRKVSKIWCNFIDNEKFQWVRKVQRYVFFKEMFNAQWNMVMKKTPVGNIKELSLAVQQFFKQDQSRSGEQWSPLQIAGAYGHLQLYRYIIEKIGNDNTDDDADGITSFHLAAQNGHLAICSFIIENTEDKNPVCYSNIGSIVFGMFVSGFVGLGCYGVICFLENIVI